MPDIRSAVKLSGLPGATSASRWVGAVNGAAPTTGTFNSGDWAPDVAGGMWVCTSGGSPGTWVKITGSYPDIFGTGSDGSATLDGTAAVAWASKSGSTYTMTRDAQLTALTVNNAVTLKTANFRIFCQGTVTNNGTIQNSGNAAAGNAGGGSMGGASLGGGRAGGAGGTGVSGAGANGSSANFGSAAGAGGAGTSGAAGAAGTPTVSTAIASASVLLTPFPVLAGLAAYNNAALPLTAAPGGGGGGSDASSNAGGGAGSGGGIVAILAWTVVNNGTITVQGGNGANGTAGNAGGGGSGAGGFILIYTLSAWTAGTTNVAGGTPGSGSGTGSNGNTGGAGLVLNVVVPNLAAAPLDTTAADIQPTGTQAAGSSGKAADAKHVHPTTGLVTGAGDASLVVTGTTIQTATLDVIASLHPPAASVGMNSQKLTSLLTGSAAGNSAEYAQMCAAAQCGQMLNLGYLGATGNYLSAQSVSENWTSGTEYLFRIDCLPGKTANGFVSVLWVNQAGMANSYIALYNSSGTQLGVTADLSATASGWKRLACTGFTATPANGIIYALWVCGTSVSGGGPKTVFNGWVQNTPVTAQLPAGAAAPWYGGNISGSATAAPASITPSNFNGVQNSIAMIAID